MGVNETLCLFPVRLYAADISADDEFYEKWYGLMPKKRRAASDRFKNEADRHRCIAAYALLVYALREVVRDTGIDVGTDAAGLLDKGIADIAGDDNGKPYLTDIPVSFSISHSGKRVAVAVSPMDVGCDVECKNRNALGIARRFFADSEYRMLCGIDDSAVQDIEFTRLWTLKESVVKCSGEGIRHEFSDFSLVDSEGTKKASVKLTGDEDIYYIREYATENGYCYSVCSKYEKMEEHIRRIGLSGIS